MRRMENGAMGTMMYQACLPMDKAMELADVKTGTPIDITGELKVIKKMGILMGLVFNDASVEVVGDAPEIAVSL